jgi:Arc/MetJ-type ribon-helix-helix transcriptional regulator
MPRDSTVTFKVREEFYREVKKKAREQDRSVSEVIRNALRGYLEQPLRKREILEHEERTQKLYQDLTTQWKEEIDRLDRIIELLEKRR